MNRNTLIGIGLLTLAAVLLYLGYAATQGLGEQITETVTGRYSDGTVWYLIAGAASAVAGVVLIVQGSRR